MSSGFISFTFRISCFISQFLFLGLFEVHYRVCYYLCSILLLLGVVCTILLPIEPVDKPLDVINVDENKNKYLNL